MPRASVTRRRGPGRGRPYSSRRAAALERALVASGGPGLLPTYDMLRGSHAHRAFQEAVMERGYSLIDSGSWPHDGAFVAGVAGEKIREGDSAFYEMQDGTLALLDVGYGWARVTVAGASARGVETGVSAFQAIYPATYLSATDDRVPVTFWMLGQHGPERRLRMIDASPWDEISRNYTASVRDELGGIMEDFEPGKGGLLLLWQGPPGTGKTWALRALVSEWLPWAEFHYITDPDAFFVENAAYMVDVLLSDSYEALDYQSGEVVSEAEPEGKWRVLILEDTGELLSAGAKEKYGQGLSRLLNVVDGLIGQGLRVLVLVTTNDELGELNAAVRRPGRCASQIVFSPLTEEEAAEWLGEDGGEATTLAELYDRSAAGRDALEASGGPVRPDTRPNALSASAAVDLDALREVAREYAPEGGYGETAWNDETKTVFWVSADWSSSDEVDAAAAAFLDVEGVEAVEHEAEAALPSGDGWQQVWPEPGSEEAYQRVLALATRPLDVAPVTASALRRPADSPEERFRVVDRAFAAFEGILQLARPPKEPEVPQVDPLAARALDALATLAGREEKPPADVHVHLSPQPLDVSVTTPPVHVRAPVTVAPAAPAPAPDVHVHVPRQEAAAAPDVHVHVPEAEAPTVKIHNHVPAAQAPKVEVMVERPRPTAVRVERDPDGTKVYVPEEE